MNLHCGVPCLSVGRKSLNFFLGLFTVRNILFNDVGMLSFLFLFGVLWIGIYLWCHMRDEVLIIFLFTLTSPCSSHPIHMILFH